MNTWTLWKEFDKHQKKEQAKGVCDYPPNLDRETHDRVSRFLFAVQAMPRAWGARPWSSHEIIKANYKITNDMFRRKMKRELGLR